MMVGKYDEAINELEYLLSIPSTLTKFLLRIDPDWNPLCSHPRFKMLIDSDK
jgi:hypothetical protein